MLCRVTNLAFFGKLLKWTMFYRRLAPLFEKTLPLLQCLISCIALPSCLSVFASKQGETCKGYQFSHRHKTGINFLHVEGVTYYAKGRFSIGKMSKYFQLLFFLYLDYLIYKIKYCVEKKSILYERSQHNLYCTIQFEYIYQKHWRYLLYVRGNFLSRSWFSQDKV